jgi:NAD(P)-dependent dehydrogenase (short-subunit alcohol dehydrogenase family)
MELDGQSAIVTGGGRGIGRAIALELAGMGARVAVADIQSDRALRTAGEVQARGGTAVGIAADVSDRASVASLVAQVVDAFGRIDVLVNNAGVFRRARPLEITDEHWDVLMRVNAKGVLVCCQAVLPVMCSAGSGLVINIASQSGKIGSPDALVYCASKAAVISMTRSLALAYARAGIRVNCICPGSIDTDWWAELDQQVGVEELGLAPGEYRRRRAEQIPLGRLGSPEDVAHVAGFLASSKAAYMTGQALNVTGGLVMF